MKYQYIVNGEILFETNNYLEFGNYIFNNAKKGITLSILNDLLSKSDGYICNMATQVKQPTISEWTK